MNFLQAENAEQLGDRQSAPVRPHGFGCQDSTPATEARFSQSKRRSGMIALRGCGGNDLRVAAWKDTQASAGRSTLGAASHEDGRIRWNSRYQARPTLSNLAVKIAPTGAVRVTPTSNL